MTSLVTSPPVVMAPREDGAEVVWGVSRLSRGWLEWETGGRPAAASRRRMPSAWFRRATGCCGCGWPGAGRHRAAACAR